MPPPKGLALSRTSASRSSPSRPGTVAVPPSGPATVRRKRVKAMATQARAPAPHRRRRKHGSTAGSADPAEAVQRADGTRTAKQDGRRPPGRLGPCVTGERARGRGADLPLRIRCGTGHPRDVGEVGNAAEQPDGRAARARLPVAGPRQQQRACPGGTLPHQGRSGPWRGSPGRHHIAGIGAHQRRQASAAHLRTRSPASTTPAYQFPASTAATRCAFNAVTAALS